MQRINKKVTIDDDRIKKRRDTFKKKKFKKVDTNLVSKPIFDISAKKEPNVIAPYYDPYEAHVHIWRTGPIPCAQDPLSKYLKFPKHGEGPITKRHCIICHTVYIPFVFTLGTERHNQQTLDVREAAELFRKENKYLFCEESDDILDKFKGMTLSETKRFEIIRGECSEEDLFIPGFQCKFYVNKECTDGKIIGFTKDNKLNVEDLNGKRHVVCGKSTVMNYDGYIRGNRINRVLNKKITNYPMSYPPSTVNVGVVYEYNGNKFTNKNIWIQRWTNFMKWKSMVEYLTLELAEKHGYKLNPPGFTDYHACGGKRESMSISDYRNKLAVEYTNTAPKLKFLIPNRIYKNKSNVYYKVIKQNTPVSIEESLSLEMKKLTLPKEATIKKRKLVCV